MMIDAVLPASIPDIEADLSSRLDALRREIGAAETQLSPVNLRAFFSKAAEKEKDALKARLAALRTQEAEMVAAIGEARSQGVAAETAASEANRKAWASIRADRINAAHDEIDRAAAEMIAARDAFLRAAIKCAVASKAAHAVVHDQSELFPRRLVASLVHDMVAGNVQMEGFVVRDVVDHWDAASAATCLASLRTAIRDGRQ